MAKIDDSVKKKVPELRFKGFTDDWEERKLKDIAQFNPKTVLPDEFEYVDLESVVGTEMISHRTESKDQAPSRAQRLAQKGDVFYQTVRPYQMNNYLYDLPYDNYVFSTGYAQMRPNIDSYFLLNSVQNKQFVQHVLDRSTGTSYPAINSSDLSNIEIHVPSKLSEQQKIGAFFQSIDDTITLHQRKLDLLKEQKKGYLQKMFPKNGEKVPELRFAGFADDWEQRKLGEISDVTKLAGFEFTKYVSYSDSGEIIALRGLNVKNGGLVLDEVKYIDGSDFSKLSRSKLFIKDILFTYVGTVGELAVVPEDNKYYLAPNVARIRMNKGANPLFVSQQMNDKSFYNRIILPLIATSSQPALSMENVRKFTLMLPSEKEQSMIADFFTKLDQTITLHQLKLDLLKEQKKGFLQKMFA